MKRKLYQFREIVPKSPTAGQKAVEDVMTIVSRMGASTIPIYRVLACNLRFLGPLSKVTAWLACHLQYWFLYGIISRDSVIIMQHPIRTPHSFMHDEDGVDFIRHLRKRKGVKIITLIHDVEEMRGGLTSQDASVESVLDVSDVIIAHNKHMADWFEKHGIGSCAITTLKLFDYLTDYVPNDAPAVSIPHRVVFPGYLGSEGKQFLAQLKEIDGVSWRLYGTGYSADHCQGGAVTYCGVAKSEELPALLQDSFLLVWDGESVDELKGRWGEYFKFINPHKLSLAMAAGIPVVTCAGTYSAEFIKERGVGIALGSLRELPKALDDLTLEKYQAMKVAAVEQSKLVREGSYLKNAIARACEMI